MTQHPTIQRPNKGETVKLLQHLLHLQEDGIFGALTKEAVLEFQRENGLKPDGIVGPKTWEMLEQVHRVEQTDDFSKLYKGQLTASRRVINEIVVHCTATPEGRDYTVADIKRWHTTPVSKGGRGWSDIGYHYVIYRDGTIHGGRPVDIAGAHASGHNSHSIGVVYVGGMDAQNKNAKDTRTDEQRRGMKALLTRLCKMYPKANVLGHRELSPDKNGDGIISEWEWMKACPSFEVSELRTELRKAGAYKA